MNGYLIYVAIESGPILDRAKAYRDAEAAAKKEWFAFAKSRGADGVAHAWPGRPPSALVFNKGKPPAGWTKLTSKHRSHPKVKHPDVETMKALPPAPSRDAVYGDAIIQTLSYEGPKHRGTHSLMGLMIDPQIGWAGDTFFGIIPDAALAARKHLERNPEDTITNGADKWVLPEGLRVITEAEMNLAYAQHDVDVERRKEEKAAA